MGAEQGRCATSGLRRAAQREGFATVADFVAKKL